MSKHTSRAPKNTSSQHARYASHHTLDQTLIVSDFPMMSSIFDTGSCRVMYLHASGVIASAAQVLHVWPRPCIAAPPAPAACAYGPRCRCAGQRAADLCCSKAFQGECCGARVEYCAFAKVMSESEWMDASGAGVRHATSQSVMRRCSA